MKISIVGGGISGLVAGIYALNNNKNEVTIYEKNNSLGGIFTSFDTECYFLYDMDNYKFYKDIGIINIDILEEDYLIAYKDLYLYKDLDKLMQELKAKSINDIKEIDELIDNINYAKKFKINFALPLDLLNIFEKSKMLWDFSKNNALIKKYNKISIKQYASRFIDTDIQVLLESCIPSYYPVYLLFVLIASYTSGKLARIKDKNDIIKGLSQKFISLGGIIKINTIVYKFDIYHGNIRGLYINDNKYIETDVILCSNDPHDIFERILENKYNDRRFSIRYEDYKTYPLFSSISLEFMSKDKLPLPHNFILKIDKIKIASIVYEYFKINVNENKLYLNIPITNDGYKYYKIISQNKNAYEKEMARNIDTIKEILNKSLKENYNLDVKLSLAKCIAPLDYENTYYRYCGNISCFAITVGGENYISDGRINNVKGLYIASGWISSPQNMLSSMLSSKNVVLRMLHDYKKETTF